MMPNKTPPTRPIKKLNLEKSYVRLQTTNAITHQMVATSKLKVYTHTAIIVHDDVSSAIIIIIQNAITTISLVHPDASQH